MITISPCNAYIENWKGKKNNDLSMKEGSLFCFVAMRSTQPDASNHVLGVFGKLLTRRGAWAWFYGIWT